MVQMNELIEIKEENERKSQGKVARMKDAVMKVGNLQEKAYINNQK